MANPVGASTKFKPEYVDVVLKMMEKGAAKVEIAAKLRVHRETLDNWEKEFPEFFDAINLGLVLSEGWWTGKGRKNLKNKDFNSRLWEINMMNRFGWMKKAQNNIEADVEFSESQRKVRDAENKY